MTALLRASTPKARQRHQCDACDRAIQPGTVYVSQTFVDVDVYVWRMHVECAQELARHDCDDGHPQGVLSGGEYIDDADMTPAFVAWRNAQGAR